MEQQLNAKEPSLRAVRSTDGLAEVIADMERKAFEKFVVSPPFEYDIDRMSEASAWPGNYRSIAVQLAWESWKERAKMVSQCKGVLRAGCNYLSACGSICNKCGQAH